jgi:hypothetical protein
VRSGPFVVLKSLMMFAAGTVFVGRFFLGPLLS